MPSDSNASFIPKRNPSKNIKRVVTRRVYLFTFFSYVTLFVALILAGVLYGYKVYIEGQIVDEVTALQAEIADFKVADMQRVTEYEQRLRIAEDRFSNQLSFARLMTLIEDSTVQTVQYENFVLERTSDTELVLSTGIITGDFDSAIFQRNLYENTSELEGFTVDGVAFSADGSTPVAAGGGGGGRAQYINPGESTSNQNQVAQEQQSNEPSLSMVVTFTLDPEVFPAQSQIDTLLPTEPTTETPASLPTTTNDTAL